jgi:hypothetical protein
MDVTSIATVLNFKFSLTCNSVHIRCKISEYLNVGSLTKSQAGKTGVRATDS